MLPLDKLGGAMRASLTSIALAATLGCGSPAYQYSGYSTYDHFPLDGERYWNYQNPGEDYLLDVTIDSTEYVNNQSIKTLRYQNATLDSVMYWIKWSSDSRSGVQIHGYMIEDSASLPDSGSDTGEPSTDAITGSWVEFSPAITVTTYQMTPGESVETDGNGVKYTSTFNSVESCPNNWADTDWDCLKITIDSDEPEPPPFVGTWHWATEFGTSLFQPKGSDNPWILTDFEWSPE
jgi:hypothetical protein